MEFVTYIFYIFKKEAFRCSQVIELENIAANLAIIDDPNNYMDLVTGQ